MRQYFIIFSEETLQDLIQFKSDLQSKKIKPGNYLSYQLDSIQNKFTSLDELTNEQFLQALLLTKQYSGYAGKVKGDGSDWNRREFKILGEISIAMKVQVYDNGVWKINDESFKEHDPPMTAHLIYTPGPLLFGMFEGETPDFEAISTNGQINQEKYNNVMKRRLLPIFLYAEEQAKQEKKKALIVVPGLGCGIFAKDFKGQMGEHLNKALQSIIKDLPPCENIACIRYDPYNECEDFEDIIGSIKFRLRKSTGPLGKPQLSRVEDFEEKKGEFDNCMLYKIVAWDHVSFPAYNYCTVVRNTDDAVAGAATNTMEVLTGVKGHYIEGFYLPPEGNRKWLTVAAHNNTKLVADGNVKVALDGHALIELNEATQFLRKKSKLKTPLYDIILSEETIADLLRYKSDLLSGNTEPGAYFKYQLDTLPNKNLSLNDLTTEQFLQMLLLSKNYEYFAGEVIGDGSDWNSREFQILGEISVTMKVIVYDNGVWKFTNDFKEHDPPMTAYLIYTPGPLLVGRFKGVIPDFEAVSTDGIIIQEKYNTLLKRRLLPIFLYAEEKAKQEKKKALIVVPGLGCGIFAKDFKGQMGEHLNIALQSVIKDLPSCENIACIRYDPFNECEDFEEIIGSIKFRLRKSTGPLGKPQLSRVEDFEETEGEFENCMLYKLVAWDHVAYPGNNYFLGVRYSDDGVAGAATNTMEVLTGVKGYYEQGFYLPPEGKKTRWFNVASSNNTKLVADGNVKVAVNSCELIKLSEYESKSR